VANISRFPIPDLGSLPRDIKERIQEVQEKSGFVPNVFLVLSHRPDEFRAFFDYHDAIMRREGNLSRAEKEMIVVATSAANDCSYCVVAHGAILRVVSGDPDLSEQLLANYRTAPLEPRQRVMLAFAVKLARTPEEVGETDLRQLAELGYTQEDIWDIGAITAFFACSNRMAHLTAMQPNEEFYSLGRRG